MIFKALKGALVAVTLTIAPVAHARDLPFAGWWVVLAYLPENGSGSSNAAVKALSERARACGVKPFNDFSGKFTGFPRRYASGYEAVVHERPYASRARALKLRAAALRCAPNATVRWGRYAGD